MRERTLPECAHDTKRLRTRDLASFWIVTRGSLVDSMVVCGVVLVDLDLVLPFLVHDESHVNHRCASGRLNLVVRAHAGLLGLEHPPVGTNERPGVVHVAIVEHDWLRSSSLRHLLSCHVSFANGPDGAGTCACW